MNPGKLTFILYFVSLLTGCQSNSDKSPSTEKTIRVAIPEDPQTSDPRFTQTLLDSTVMHALYEGLFRIDSAGNIQYALAEEVTPSQDLTQYVVRLKKSVWSDGTPLTAADFVETWKSILDPASASPNASQFYSIKGAKAAKEGKLPLDEVGLKIVSDNEFTIELERPLSYFDKILATQFFLPVSQKTRDNRLLNPAEMDYNGPFLLKEWKSHNVLVFKKNPLYWDSSNVQLDQLAFLITDEANALSLFKKNALDWIGSPMHTLPQDAIDYLKQNNMMQTAPSCGTYWIRFNTEAPPFDSLAMRKAFNSALNRTEIVDHVTQGGQIPALSILPASISLNENGYYQDNQPTVALENLNTAFSQPNISSETPKLLYVSNDRNNKLAQTIQQQWQNGLNIPIILVASEAKTCFEKRAKKDYQMLLGSWFAEIDDPVGFLDVFKSKDNGINCTGWEDAGYAALLEEANQESDKIKRKALLAKAETILMDHMPIAPLFHSTYNYVKNENIQGVYFSELGFLDFKTATIQAAPK